MRCTLACLVLGFSVLASNAANAGGFVLKFPADDACASFAVDSIGPKKKAGVIASGRIRESQQSYELSFGRADDVDRFPRFDLCVAQVAEDRQSQSSAKTAKPAEAPQALAEDIPIMLLIANAQASIAKFPAQFRLVRWHAEATRFSGGGVHVLYWKGKPKLIGDPDDPIADWTGVKIRQASYFNLSDRHPSHHLPLPADCSQVLDWTDGQTPVSLMVADGHHTYSQNGPYPPAVEQKKPVVQVMWPEGNRPLFDYNSWPTTMYWPFVTNAGSRRKGHHEFVGELSGLTPGTVILRISRACAVLITILLPTATTSV